MPRFKKSTSIATLVLLAIMIACGTGCGRFWNSVRESERGYAANSAKTYVKRGDCERALLSLDRAEATREIGAYGKEATRQRLICYELLGRHAAARAHRRLLDDFYNSEKPPRASKHDSSILRVTHLPKINFEKPPAAFEFASPQYSEYARRSHIVGRVVVAFALNENYEPNAIRVLEMTHPLLASWSIEAIERSGKSKKKGGPTVVPSSGFFVTTFSFEYKYAKSGVEVDETKEEYEEEFSEDE